MFKNILVPMDGSDPSSNALDLAVDLAKFCGSRLSLVHVINRSASIESLREVAERHRFLDRVEEDLSNPDIIVPVATPATGVPIIVVPDAVLAKFGDLLLETSAAKVRSRGLDNVVTALLDGDPADEILRYAEPNGIDLIATGSRGLGGLKSLFLGSVSHKLVENAKCPCLVVK
ncbi:MAG TPA: universal stress protein [Kiloniellales bacterium]